MFELCFSSFVFGSYQKYIPYYIYSISKVYPQAFVKVFVDEDVEKKVKESLALIEKSGYRNFSIEKIENSATERYRKYRIRGGGKKLCRWLLDGDEFNQFKYVYFGDIDIMILPEKISIIEFHKNQMNELQLPFSNKVRLTPDGTISSRLTGLHFIECKEYYEKINPIVKKITTDLEFRNDYLKDLDRDEKLLYKLCHDAFLMDPEKLSSMGRPWHGLHLGITRGKKKLSKTQILENSSLDISEIIKLMKKYESDPVFKKIKAKLFLRELFDVYKGLGIRNSLAWILYNSYSKFNFLK